MAPFFCLAVQIFSLCFSNNNPLSAILRSCDSTRQKVALIQINDLFEHSRIIQKKVIAGVDKSTIILENSNTLMNNRVLLEILDFMPT